MIEKYKDSRIPFIGQIPQEWEVLRNKNLFFLDKRVVGNRFSEYQLLSLTKNGVIEKDIEDISGKQPESYDTYQAVKKGTLIMCLFDLDCSAVFSGISKFDGMISPAYKIMHGNDKAHMRYYDYLFWHIARERSYKTFSKNVRYTIGDDEFGWIKTICPSVAEQKAIADLLDEECGKIDAIVADMELQVEILKAYKKVVITEAVTKGIRKGVSQKESAISWIGSIPKHWSVKRLKYLGTARNGLTYDPENISDDGILVLRSSNIQDDRLIFDDNVFVNMSIPQEILLRENDLLLCSRNGSRDLIGKCALIDNATAGQTYGAFMCVFRSDYNRFIHYVFLSEVFSFYIGTYLTTTINQLTNTNLYNIKIPIPMDFDEQQAIADYLDEKCAEIDAIIKDKQTAVDTLKEYKKSLIYEYVTGKKRVKEAE